MSNKLFWLLGCVGLLQPKPGWAHGEIHLQIAVLSEKIREMPGNHELYLQRGELYRLHRQWDAALADFESARSLATNQVALDFFFGRLFLEAGWPETAKTVLDRFLAAQPRHSEGHLLRARALVQLDKPLEAVNDYSEAINAAPAPSPGFYLERAHAEASAGPGHIAQALRGLDQGMERLGLLVTLQLPAIELELKRKAYDDALQRLEKIAALSPRQETWLKRRGEILLQADRLEEARRAFQKALEALHALPPARRFVPAMAELEKELLIHLENPPAADPANPASNR